VPLKRTILSHISSANITAGQVGDYATRNVGGCPVAAKSVHSV